MAEPAPDYADGSVHALTMGSIELRGVLDAAAQCGQLVVVDFRCVLGVVLWAVLVGEWGSVGAGCMAAGVQRA